MAGVGRKGEGGSGQSREMETPAIASTIKTNHIPQNALWGVASSVPRSPQNRRSRSVWLGHHVPAVEREVPPLSQKAKDAPLSRTTSQAGVGVPACALAQQRGPYTPPLRQTAAAARSVPRGLVAST